MLGVLPARAQTVVRHSDPSVSLESRIDWAFQEAQSGRLDAFWIAYSIKRQMKENSWMGHFSNDWTDKSTLAEVLDGRTDVRREPLSVKEAARRALDNASHEYSEKFVEKEIVVLMLFEGQDRVLTDVDLSNIELSFDFENHPIVWVRGATDGESIAYLVDTFGGISDTDVQEDIVSAVGMHEDLIRVRPFLVDVIESRVHYDVRENAVFWLNRHKTNETVRYLSRLAENDRSEDVRENAVFALSRMDLDSALDRLIQLAWNANDEEVEEKARFWLGQKASRRLLGDVNENDERSKIQKQAVFALAQMDDGAGVSELIELVQSHNNPVVRKQALFWLGQSEDDRALETIIEILRPGS